MDSTGRNQKETFSSFSSSVLGGQAGSKPCDLKKWLILGAGTMPEPGLRGPNGPVPKKSPVHIWGWLPASPTALWRLIPVYTDTLFVSIGACLAGGPTHPECCFGMKLGMEPDAAENLRKGSLPSEAGRAECSYPQGFRRESQVDIIKKNPVKCPRYFGKWMTL